MYAKGIITLCGSVKFWDTINMVEEQLALEGWLVIPISVKGKDAQNQLIIPKDKKQMLDKIHLDKIDISHAIFVVNVDNYIGESTSNEIFYAALKGKIIFYYYPIPNVTVLSNTFKSVNGYIDPNTGDPDWKYSR